MKHIPRKRFGQHFLADAAIIAAIVDAIAPQAGETLVEIGPGLAALTAPLLARVPHLHVVEIDRDIVARLRKTRSAAELTIHEGDALEFDFGAIGSDLRIVGNLPYNISTPLLFHLADYADQVRDMHFMLQKEVVERMVAEPGGTDYGRLSVMLQFRFHMDWLLDVPPESFDPPPKVDSAVVRMIPKRRDELPDVDEATLQRVVTAAFGQRRKMLRNTLREILGEDELLRLGIAPTLRAEDVPVDGFVRIAQTVSARAA
jgi:16S rRNA (adenine1518-N6/adenine1519-N6)-dimethyltransferase